jgi:hypothetical protein
MQRNSVTSILEAELIVPKGKTMHFIAVELLLSATVPFPIKARIHDLLAGIQRGID